jgi:hypothetical protein
MIRVASGSWAYSLPVVFFRRDAVNVAKFSYATTAEPLTIEPTAVPIRVPESPNRDPMNIDVTEARALATSARGSSFFRCFCLGGGVIVTCSHRGSNPGESARAGSMKVPPERRVGLLRGRGVPGSGEGGTPGLQV